MCEHFLSSIFVFLTFLHAIQPQQLSDGNFVSDYDSDHQDFQTSARQLKSQLLAKFVKTRAPIIGSQYQPTKVTPVPILKQINRHNEDGSYTYGFEGADGSFKIETKLATGEVIGKYGYVDDSGKTRVVDYGANKYGFQPAGEGITIPPVTIVNETDTEKSSDDEESSQYTPTPYVLKHLARGKNAKRKSQKPVQISHSDLRTKHQNSPVYYVQEQEENLPPRFETNQKSFITPADINSLQYVVGKEFRDTSPSHQKSHESSQRKSSASASEENGNENDGLRPFSQSLPIPVIFETAQTSQPVNEFPHSRYPTQQYDFTSQDGGLRNSIKTPSRSKQKPQFYLLTPMDDVRPQQTQSAMRRNFNNVPESRSILDELLKQYAIPNGSPPINDYSFSYTN